MEVTEHDHLRYRFQNYSHEVHRLELKQQITVYYFLRWPQWKKRQVIINLNHFFMFSDIKN